MGGGRRAWHSSLSCNYKSSTFRMAFSLPKKSLYFLRGPCEEEPFDLNHWCYLACFKDWSSIPFHCTPCTCYSTSRGNARSSRKRNAQSCQVSCNVDVNSSMLTCVIQHFQHIFMLKCCIHALHFPLPLLFSCLVIT